MYILPIITKYLYEIISYFLLWVMKYNYMYCKCKETKVCRNYELHIALL